MGTRICIKNLPKRLYNEFHIKKHFSECGTITCVDLPALGKGKATGIAFVGFKDKESAPKAVKHFDNTFMGTTRIRVSPYLKLLYLWFNN